MIRPILSFPDPLLKQKSLPVETVTDEVIQLARDMAETMYAAPGVGLAAPQVGVLKRVIVMDVSGKEEDPRLITVINPIITSAEGSVYEEEGCLSVPEYSASVRRHERVTVSGLSPEGQERIWQADGLLAIAFQHEIDHLDGILFIDRLSPLKREMYLKNAEKRNAMTGWRIIFMGTPAFACPALTCLLDRGEEVIAVFTQPDRPKGRGQKLQPPPVKELALSRGIPVFQPSRVRVAEVIEQIRGLQPDLIVVVAFGQILPQALLDIPSHGCVNIHASLLPRYRGAAPLNWCIVNGETETGVTTMLMDAGLDTGPMLLKEVRQSARMKIFPVCMTGWRCWGLSCWEKLWTGSSPAVLLLYLRMMHKVVMLLF